MYKIKFTKDTVKNHIRYDFLKYVAITVVLASIFNIVFTSTSSFVDPDKKLTFYVVGDVLHPVKADSENAKLMEAFSDMEQIIYENLATESESAGYTYRQKFVSIIAAKRGDLFIMSYLFFQDLVTMGAFTPVDERLLDHVESAPDQLKKAVYYKLDDEKGAQYYAIPYHNGEFMTYSGMDASDKVLVIPAYTQNYETAVRLAQWLLEYKAPVVDKK